MKFITVDSTGLVNGMYIEDPLSAADGFSEDEVESQRRRGLIALSDDEWVSVGPGYAYVDGSLLPPAPPTQEEEMAVKKEANKNMLEFLVSEATQRIVVWQTKLLIGRKLSASESALLNTWLDYIDQLNAIDTEATAEISWPSKPTV